MRGHVLGGARLRTRRASRGNKGYFQYTQAWCIALRCTVHHEPRQMGLPICNCHVQLRVTTLEERSREGP